jgi:hypothetical protein
MEINLKIQDIESEEINKSYFTFENQRESINRTAKADENVESNDSVYIYERRRGNNTSNFFRYDRFDKVIIPYNFENKKYEIRYKDIEFYENKIYIIEKLEEFNQNPYFDIDKKYKPKNCLEIFLINFPMYFILTILIYFGCVFTFLSSFNLIVIYTLYSYIKKAYNSLEMLQFILLEKWKINNISLIISNENKTDNCISKEITWKIGTSGYWMEVQKNNPE